jgi:predicted membrane metal-binding protein
MMIEAFMAAQKGMLCQILQTQQQLVQMLQQQPPLSANPDGPNLVAQTMLSIGKDPERPRPYESFSPRVPTQGNIDTIAGAIEMLEEQNSVLSHIVDNILQDRYQGLSQTSLTDGLSQALFTSVVEQARLCNLLADHMKKSQLNTSDSLLPPLKLPMDLTKE